VTITVNPVSANDTLSLKDNLINDLLGRKETAEKWAKSYRKEAEDATLRAEDREKTLAEIDALLELLDPASPSLFD
jgi:FKBP-type peptidyl-prolyl cis-trans isomerase (trigger factor)